VASDDPVIDRFARALDSHDRELTPGDAERLAEIACEWAARRAEGDEHLGCGRDVRGVFALAEGVVAGAVAWRDACR
jgi:hypothetical protein